jgi:hypothetical protein
MANTFFLINQKTLDSAQAAVEFTDIPQTYSDLVAIVSGRSNQNGTNRGFVVSANNNNPTGAMTLGDENASLYTGVYTGCYLAGSDTTANLFAATEFNVYDYTNSTRSKNIYFRTVNPNPSTSAYGAAYTAAYYASNTPITSMKFTITLGNFVAGSSFYLYGIKNT